MGRWSKALEVSTRESIFSGAMVKSINHENGFCFIDNGTITIYGVVTKNYMPLPGKNVIARFDSLDRMIEAGWVID